MRRHFLRYAGIVPRHLPEPRAEQNLPLPDSCLSPRELLNVGAWLSGRAATIHPFYSYVFLQRLWLGLSPFLFMSRALCPHFTALHTATTASFPTILFDFAATHLLPSSSLPPGHEQRTGGVYMQPRELLLHGCI
jgi:hypothetical protein